MDGVHDMGGMDGFGKVEPEPNEPVFHHRWEGRVLAMSRAIGVFRAWTIDTSRYAIEKLAPSIYLTRSYYEKWFLRNQNLLIERGLIDFPHLRDGQEVLLCWELSEERVAYWHDLETGYGGRRPIESQLQFDTVTRQRGNIQRFEAQSLYHRRHQHHP